MSNNLNDAPWSAAFICWIMKQVNVKFPLMPESAAHVNYANAIRNNQRLYPFRCLSPTNADGTVREIFPGDIIVFNRNGNNLTFNENRWEGSTHGDIVTKVDGDNIYLVGGNASDRVFKGETRRGLLMRNGAFVIIRYNGSNHVDNQAGSASIRQQIIGRVRTAIVREAEKQLLDWQTNNWFEDLPGGQERVHEYWSAIGLNRTPSLRENRQSPVPYRAPAAISPHIQADESFHPKIQLELTKRSIGANTADVHMPFVKLTSLSSILPRHITGVDNETDTSDPSNVTLSDAYCPQLGIHGQQEVTFDAIYQPVNDKSTVAYAISNSGKDRVPVVVANKDKDQRNIPMPGITKISTERSTAGPMGVRGGLFRANISILAYSVGQLDTLLTYFLRPGTRVVLELGRMTSNRKNEIVPIDWNRPKDDIIAQFSELVVDPEAQREFIRRHVYGSYGNYEAFIGYVVKFNLNYTKDNLYEIELTMHSVQQFEVPSRHTAIKSTCANPISNCEAIDIQEYFDDKYAWKNNTFNKLISAYLDPENVTEYSWAPHIVPIKNSDTNTESAGSTQAGTRENEYFVTWDFFINKILHDNIYGVASLFGTGNVNEDLKKTTLPRQVTIPTDNHESPTPIANQVGYHPSLRSTDPSTMIIYNEEAQRRYEKSRDSIDVDTIAQIVYSESRENSESQENTEPKSTFYESIVSGSVVGGFRNVSGNQDKAGLSYLQHGVWINTAAIKRAFAGTDTITQGVSALLTSMNTATQGYWNLQLYSTDSGLYVIDMGVSKSPRKPSGKTQNIATSGIFTGLDTIKLEEFQESTDRPDSSKYIYAFNKKTQVFPDGDMGSEITDMKIEFNLPQVIAVQAIANIGGPAQKSTLQSINVRELQRISLIKNLYSGCEAGGVCVEDAGCKSDIARNLSEAIEEAARTPSDSSRNRLREARLQDAQTRLNPNAVNQIREYGDLGTAITLVELNTSRMMKEMNLDSTNAEENRFVPTAHAFNSSNLTKTIAEVSMPGIGGIFLFQSFVVDRAPSILDKGFYVVTKVVHEFEPRTGWITKVQGRFRYRPTSTNTKPYNPCDTGAGISRNPAGASRTQSELDGGLLE